MSTPAIKPSNNIKENISIRLSVKNEKVAGICDTTEWRSSVTSKEVSTSSVNFEWRSIIIL